MKQRLMVLGGVFGLVALVAPAILADIPAYKSWLAAIVSGANIVYTQDKVGIGTASPTEPLDVVGSAKVSANLAVDSPTLVVDAANDRVGIGTTAPTQKFEVVGTVKAAGFQMPTGAQATYVLTSDTTGVGTWQQAQGGLGGSGTINAIPKFIGITTLENSVITESLGNVGIGTATPTAKLEVVGNAKVSANLTVDTNTLHVDAAGNRVGIGTTSPIEPLHLSHPTPVILVQDSDSVGGTSVGFLAFRDSAGVGLMSLDFQNGMARLINWINGSDLRFFTTLPFPSGTQTRMTLKADGNVGIGTTDPTERLQVVGVIHSTAGGFKFPDGTIQTSAASGPNLWALNPQGHIYNVNPGGNVGIWTSSPGTALDIGGSAAVVRTAPGGIVQIRGASGVPSWVPPGGQGLEIGWEGDFGLNQGFIRAYDRSNALYRSFAISGSPLLLTGGNVGVGTLTPNARLQVTGGDAAVTTQGSGVILKATDGPNCYRLTVNNVGALSTSSVACP